MTYECPYCAVGDGKHNLSPREVEVLHDAMRGETMQSSARLLGLAVGTVKTRRYAILRKLHSHSMAEAVAVYGQIVPTEEYTKGLLHAREYDEVI